MALASQSSRTIVPFYGQRPGWKPTSAEDFGMSNELLLQALGSFVCRGRWRLSRMSCRTVSTRNGQEESMYSY